MSTAYLLMMHQARRGAVWYSCFSEQTPTVGLDICHAVYLQTEGETYDEALLAMRRALCGHPHYGRIIPFIDPRSARALDLAAVRCRSANPDHALEVCTKVADHSGSCAYWDPSVGVMRRWQRPKEAS